MPAGPDRSRSRRLPGSGTTPALTLAKAAGSLCPPFEVAPGETERGVRLRDPAGVLPDAVLSLEKERKIFSRTMFLVVTAQVAGRGPPDRGAVMLRRARFARRASVGWDPAGDRDGEAWALRFRDAGILEGAATMTNVQHLVVRWAPPERRWLFRLETLAGALIGTGPGAGVAVPMEPEDREGLLAVLQAVVAAIRSAPEEITPET